jgi:steroid delta-isomerase-like uncharacterized protein
MASTQTSDLVQVADAFIKAFDAGDWQRFKAPLSPDVAYEETGTGRHTQGADVYVQLVQGWKQAFPDVTGTIRQAIGSGNTVVQEITWEGTHTGELLGPAGIMPPSGKRIAVPASVWYTFQGDQISEIHHHLDMMSMLQQLGAIPTPGAGGS